MIGTQFQEAVKLAERNEATELDSIVQGLNSVYMVYDTKLNEIRARKAALLEKVEECYENEGLIQVEYMEARKNLLERLDILKRQKLGTPQADEAIRQRANGLGVRP
jgi:hypothetical protein